MRVRLSQRAPGESRAVRRVRSQYARRAAIADSPQPSEFRRAAVSQRTAMYATKSFKYRFSALQAVGVVFFFFSIVLTFARLPSRLSAAPQADDDRPGHRADAEAKIMCDRRATSPKGHRNGRLPRSKIAAIPAISIDTSSNNDLP